MADGKHLLALGCGYSARRLARGLLAEGWRVSGTTRSDQGCDALRAEGIAPLLYDGSAPLGAGGFDGVSHILVSIPPGTEGDLSLAQHRAALAASNSLQWVCILSTTGVYGDSGGAWIDESFAPAPLTDANRRRLQMEQGWLEFGAEAGIDVQVIRLPGIYGPGRSPFARLRAGQARRILKPGQVFNRIHVDDIAAACRAAMAHPKAGPVFHIADGVPAPADEVLAHAAELLGMDPPPAVPLEEAGLPPMALHFYAECKRLDITKAREELGFTPIHPDYRAGLAAILKEETGA